MRAAPVPTPRLEERSEGQAPSLYAERLTFQPAGETGPTPIRDLSFVLPAGGTLLVAGPTGCGKSTLLRIIAGLAGLYPEPRASGSLVVVDPERPQEAALPVPRPGRVGMLFQDAGDGLLGIDVFTALALPLEQQGLAPWETARRVADALERYGIGRLAARDVASLSVGERKRAALAGIEALDPPLVLLDEPLAHLDAAGARQVLQDLRRLKHRRTVIIAEHRTAPLAHLVDRTLHLLGDPEPPPGPGPEPGVVTQQQPGPRVVARQLALRRGGRLLFDDARLVLTPGAYGLVGPNGAGKSSLLAVLAGLLRPDKGSVTMDGVPVWTEGRRPRRSRRVETTLRRRLQVTFQEPRAAFFAADVVEEVAAPLDALGIARRDDALADAQALLDAAGLGTLGTRSPLRLSGGEARRVQTLGALAVGPRVLMLDEPTHGLDPHVRQRLAATIEAFAQNGGIVVVATHETDLLPLDAQWLWLPGDGRLLAGAAARAGALDDPEATF